MNFLRNPNFRFFRKKCEKNLCRGYILVRHKMRKTPIEVFEDLCLAYSDSALSYVGSMSITHVFSRNVTYNKHEKRDFYVFSIQI